MHYDNCIIARWICRTSRIRKKPVRKLSTSRRWILPPLFPCREAAASVEDLSQSTRRLGEDCSRHAGDEAARFHSLLLPPSFQPSPFPSGITEHWSPIVSIGFSHPGCTFPTQPPRRAMVRLLFSGDTSSRESSREAREKPFDRISIRRKSLRYVSEVKFIEICAYACSETFLRKGTDSSLTPLTAFFEKTAFSAFSYDIYI